MTAMTVAEAREKNTAGIATGGCWRCIMDARVGTGMDRWENARTQWEIKDLKFIAHRQFCETHYREEIRGERDF